MPIATGDNASNNRYAGDNKVDAVYRGDDLVWEHPDAPTFTAFDLSPRYLLGSAAGNVIASWNIADSASATLQRRLQDGTVTTLDSGSTLSTTSDATSFTFTAGDASDASNTIIGYNQFPNIPNGSTSEPSAVTDRLNRFYQVGPIGSTNRDIWINIDRTITSALNTIYVTITQLSDNATRHIIFTLNARQSFFTSTSGSFSAYRSQGQSVFLVDGNEYRVDFYTNSARTQPLTLASVTTPAPFAPVGNHSETANLTQNMTFYLTATNAVGDTSRRGLTFYRVIQGTVAIEPGVQRSHQTGVNTHVYQPFTLRRTGNPLPRLSIASSAGTRVTQDPNRNIGDELVVNYELARTIQAGDSSLNDTITLTGTQTLPSDLPNPPTLTPAVASSQITWPGA